MEGDEMPWSWGSDEETTEERGWSSRRSQNRGATFSSSDMETSNYGSVESWEYSDWQAEKEPSSVSTCEDSEDNKEIRSIRVMPDSPARMLLLKKKVFNAARNGDVTTIVDSLKNADKQVCAEVLHHHTENATQSLTPLMIAAMLGHRDVVHLLLEVYGVAVDQTGTFHSTYGKKVTAFWCVSRSCLACREIFQLLLNNGANINHADEQENETALFQACKEGSLEMVKYLVSHGADVNIPNRKGRTPLMAVFSEDVLSEPVRMFPRVHTECAQYLLEQGADPNFQDSMKRTALHLAVLCGKHDVVTLLLNHGALLMRDSDGLTPPLCGHLEQHYGRDVVRSFVQHPQVCRQDKVDALEALGAVICLKDMDLGYPYLEEAMKERFRDPANILSKPTSPPFAILENAMESQTLKELKTRRLQYHALMMECLLILERVYMESTQCRRFMYKKVFQILESLGQADKILPLWHCLMQKHPRGVTDCLLGAVYASELLLKQRMPPKLCEMEPLIDCAVEAWENENDSSESKDNKCSEKKNYLLQVDACLRFCEFHLSTISEAAERDPLKKVMKPLVRVLNVKAAKLPHSLLHVAVERFLDSIYLPGESELGMHVTLIRLLAECGADVDVVNAVGDTPLAVITLRPLPEYPEAYEAVKNVIESLLEAGAHLDSHDKYGTMPMDASDSDMRSILRKFLPLPLRCLASRAIVKQRLPYQHFIPEVLQKFVQLHVQEPTRQIHWNQRE